MLIGEQIGAYRIIEIIGEGGMGMVGKAESQQGRIVALKQIRPHVMNHPDVMLRFEREQRLLQNLTHPNIVPILDTGVHQGLPYFVMAFIDGESLASRLRRKALSPEQIDVVVRDIGDALAYSHNSNVLHRDIKPSNILLAKHGRAYLTDFGIASAQTENERITRSIQHSELGTQNYMAPEVLHNGRPASVYSEVFSFGVTIYEMFTQRVFIKELYNGDPWQYLPANIVPILAAATHFQPLQRYPSMVQFTAPLLAELNTLKPTVAFPAFKPQTTSTLPTTPYPAVFNSTVANDTNPNQPKTPIANSSSASRIIAGVVGFIFLAFVIILMLALSNQAQNEATIATDTPTITPELTAETTSTPYLIATSTLRPSDTPILSEAQIIETDEAATATVLANVWALFQAQTATAQVLGTAYAQATQTEAASNSFGEGQVLRTARSADVYASVGGQVVYTLPANAAVRVMIQPDNDIWFYTDTVTGINYYHVQPMSSSQGYGWVKADDLYVPVSATAIPTATITPTPREPAANFTVGFYVRVNSGTNGWLQPFPYFSGDQNNIVPPGSILTVIGGPQYNAEDGGNWWWQLRSGTGATGWAEQYLLQATTDVPTATITPDDAAANFAIGSYVRIIDGNNGWMQPFPIFSGDDNNILPSGSIVTVVDSPVYNWSESQWWWQVRTGTGVTGWLQQYLLQATTDVPTPASP